MAITKRAEPPFKWLNSAICGVSSKLTELPEALTNAMLLSVMGKAENLPLDVLAICTATLVVPAGLGEGEGLGDMLEPQPITRPKQITVAKARKVDNKYVEPDCERNFDAIFIPPANG